VANVCHLTEIEQFLGRTPTEQTAILDRFVAEATRDHWFGMLKHEQPPSRSLTMIRSLPVARYGDPDHHHKHGATDGR
jgi:hypothetical protein